MRNVAEMLEALHAQESKKASGEKATAVVAELKSMKLSKTSGGKVTVNSSSL